MFLSVILSNAKDPYPSHTIPKQPAIDFPVPSFAYPCPRAYRASAISGKYHG
jgi:hypothetical protein